MADTATPSHKDRFVAGWDRLASDDAPAWLKSVRERGFAQFQELELPHPRMEDWRFTNVAPILNAGYAPRTAPAAHNLNPEELDLYSFPEPSWSELVFVDGFLAPELSRLAPGHQALTVSGLRDSARRNGNTLEDHLDRHIEKRDAFAALNAAFVQDGAFVAVPDDTVVDGAIHLVFITTGHASGASIHPRNVILIGRNSQANVVESHVSADGAGSYLSNAVAEIVLQDGARLAHHKIINEGGAGNHLAATTVRQEAHSYFTSFVFTFGGAIARNELQVLLAGQGAECSLHGLYLNDGDRLIDNFIDIDHAVPHCRSRIAYKGVLDNASKAVFTGKVDVRRGAQKTDSNQLNQNFLLADGATIDTKPQLEIYADDVKCTHGATIGSPPEQVVFYFRSRGMDEAMARGILTYGFASEVVYDLDLDPLKARLNAEVFDRYSPKGRPQGV